MERALVELAQRGDQEAFVSLIRLTGDRLLIVASRILRDVDLAEDAAAVAREVPGSRFAAAVEESAIGRRGAIGVRV